MWQYEKATGIIRTPGNQETHYGSTEVEPRVHSAPMASLEIKPTCLCHRRFNAWLLLYTLPLIQPTYSFLSPFLWFFSLLSVAYRMIHSYLDIAFHLKLSHTGQWRVYGWAVLGWDTNIKSSSGGWEGLAVGRELSGHKSRATFLCKEVSVATPLRNGHALCPGPATTVSPLDHSDDLLFPLPSHHSPFLTQKLVKYT